MFVRRDLPLPQQAVQACHACIEMARDLLPPPDEHPHLVLCGVKSEQQLAAVADRLRRLNVAFRSFRDADWDGQLTAVATAPLRGPIRRQLRRYQCLRGEPQPPHQWPAGNV